MKSLEPSDPFRIYLSKEFLFRRKEFDEYLFSNGLYEIELIN